MKSAVAHVATLHLRELYRWYEAHRRLLPFRETKDPYAIWISETMLQQTRVAAMLPAFENFMKRFPTVHALARSQERTLMAAWRGLGYYRRARNLRLAARAIVDAHGGVFPTDYETVLALPGVGPYTAAAVLSIAYDQEHAAVDGNVRRVVSRLTSLATPAVSADAETLLLRRGRASPGTHNQAMMELGATVCLPRTPRCPQCPLRVACRGFALHGESVDAHLPLRSSSTDRVAVRLGIGVVHEMGGRRRILLVRDARSLFLPDHWFFPTRASLLPEGLGSDSESVAYESPGCRELVDWSGRQPGELVFRHSITKHRIQGEARKLPVATPFLEELAVQLGEERARLVEGAELDRWVVSSMVGKMERLLAEFRERPRRSTGGARRSRSASSRGRPGR